MEDKVRFDEQSQDSASARAEALIERFEWILGIVVSAVALFLFVVRVTHAGSLWRDEADSVQSAQLPFGEMLHAVQFSSFPILFPLIVRAHTTLFGAGDVSLRCFGLAVGILVLAISWLPIRRVIGNIPLLLLAMVGLNANFLIPGMSLRAYALGSLLVLLGLVATINFLRIPNLHSLIAVATAFLVSLHCLFWSAPLVLAMTIAAVVALWLRRQYKWITLLSVVLLGCGLSQIPYLQQFRSSLSSWQKIIEVPASFNLVWQYFFVGWGDIAPEVSTGWLVLIALAVTYAIWRFATNRNGDRGNQRHLILFGIFLIPFSIIASYALALTIHRSPEQRFFLAMTLIVAASADLLWRSFPAWLRLARILLVTVAVVTLPIWIWGYLVQAESNAETVAKIVEQRAVPRDLVVVNPWTYGVTFNWYYHGAARWVTVPQTEDHRIHRYDLVLAKMEATSPLADVEAEIENVLESGGRVWFAGQLEVPVPGESPAQVGPAPDPNIGWSGSAYRKAWSQQISLFLVRHVQNGNPVDTHSWATISAREIFSLYELEGWKY